MSRAVDVVIVGGGPAGSTAALVLARARHRVLVVDDRTYRNRAVVEFHGFPTRDGTRPAALVADAHAELRRYGVSFTASPVVDARPIDHGSLVQFADGHSVSTAAVVIATGVHDELPPIRGLAERWGRSVFNCPFCDGWEHRDRPVVVIDAAPGAEHLADLLRSWTSEVTVVAACDVATLEGAGRTLERLVLRDGRVIVAEAVFVKAPVAPRNDVARRLGCVLDVDGYVVTDAQGRTSNPVVWAAGDLRRSPPQPHQVILAAADGSAAAISIHKAFVHGELGRSTTTDPAWR
ncbi:MAG: NAD(P)/FAD-dependent oxidoreductase [Acidimicrobiales bacterium]